MKINLNKKNKISISFFTLMSCFAILLLSINNYSNTINQDQSNSIVDKNLVSTLRSPEIGTKLYSNNLYSPDLINDPSKRINLNDYYAITNADLIFEVMSESYNSRGKLKLIGTTNKNISWNAPIINKGDFISFYDTNDERYEFVITEIGANAFSDCAGIVGKFSIVQEDEVTSIGDNAFSNCINITSVTGRGQNDLDKQIFALTSIGSSAFDGCINLENFAWSNQNLKSIGIKAFYNCSKLNKNLIMPWKAEIGDLAFGECKLQSVEFQTKFPPVIGEQIFYNNQTDLNSALIIKIPPRSKQAYDQLTINKFGINDLNQIVDTADIDPSLIEIFHVDLQYIIDSTQLPFIIQPYSQVSPSGAKPGVKWSLDPAVDDVTINETTGEITVVSLKQGWTIINIMATSIASPLVVTRFATKLAFELAAPEAIDIQNVQSTYELDYDQRKPLYPRAILTPSNANPQINWSIDDNQFIENFQQSTGAFTFVGKQAGTHTIKVKATSNIDNEKFGEKTITFNVKEEILVVESIELLAFKDELIINQFQLFDVKVKYTNGKVKDAVDQWTISKNGQPAILNTDYIVDLNNANNFKFLTTGSYTAIATTDSITSNTINFNVRNYANLVTITSDTNENEIKIGQTVLYTATVDGSDNNLEIETWIVSAPNIKKTTDNPNIIEVTFNDNKNYSITAIAKEKDLNNNLVKFEIVYSNNTIDTWVWIVIGISSGVVLIGIIAITSVIVYKKKLLK